MNKEPTLTIPILKEHFELAIKQNVNPLYIAIRKAIPNYIETGALMDISKDYCFLKRICYKPTDKAITARLQWKDFFTIASFDIRNYLTEEEFLNGGVITLELME